ncbi:MAG: hypothetical protein RQ739_15045 [Desulfotignum sp.]|nr:hypothetical protein [Desulfotignum sp.]
MSIYLCYDIKGIQSFIFKIPKLKYIVGGSALIDQFDKETMKNMSVPGTKHIFSGGGKGTFLCESKTSLEQLRKGIIEQAHAIGLDIRFGENEDFSQAAQHADQLYAFVPSMHPGYPCPESGLYPVKPGETCHPVVRKRQYFRGEKMFRRFEDLLLTDILIPGRSNDELEFFHNVNSDETDGLMGAAALGNRNRCAVISMDGNDMGMQFRQQVKNKLTPEQMMTWIKDMSRALDSITVSAAAAGIQRVVSDWAGSDEGKEMVINKNTVTLPIRPLLVGGDDIVALCHGTYAVAFVKEVIRVFEERSRDYGDLWPATGGALSITAGILFAPVSLPLHTAIPYSESLLASAKSRGRKEGKPGQPTPACVDWEQITDTVVDTPAARRQRDMLFFDEAIQRRVKLTRRPYTLQAFTRVENLAEQYSHIPRTTRHKIFPALCKGHAERLAFAAEIKKNHPDLFSAIDEFDFSQSCWELDKDKTEQSTMLIDALMLLEEDNRMKKETV